MTENEPVNSAQDDVVPEPTEVDAMAGEHHQVLLLLRLGRGVIADRLEVDLRVMHVRPLRLGHRQPVPIGLQPEFQQPFRLILFRRNHADDVLAQPLRRGLGLDIRDETMPVRLADEVVENCTHVQIPGSRVCGNIQASALTVKLSPQPQVASTLGFSTLNACFRPSRT